MSSASSRPPSAPAAPLKFRLAPDVCGSLRDVLLSRHWQEFDGSVDNSSSGWNLQWKTTRYSPEEYAGPCENQRINHFQATHGICKKDSLARNLRRMSRTFGDFLYRFSPETFILPREKAALEEKIKNLQDKKNKKKQGKSRPQTGEIEENERMNEENPSSPPVWICKPSSSSQGKNIFLFQSPAELSYSVPCVVQRYIDNPLLIGGYKFDLRIYLLVVSFHPLKVFIANKGLVRFSTVKYNLDDLSDVFSHLTNASINKFSPSLEAEKESIGSGSKWTLEQFWPFLRENFPQPNGKPLNTERLWAEIIDISLLTLFSISPEIPVNPRCFELFGFDILIDSSFDCHLLEVNSSPAIAIGNEQDENVKYSVLSDLIDLIGFPQEGIQIKMRKKKINKGEAEGKLEDEENSSDEDGEGRKKAGESPEDAEPARPIQGLPRLARLEAQKKSVVAMDKKTAPALKAKVKEIPTSKKTRKPPLPQTIGASSVLPTQIPFGRSLLSNNRILPVSQKPPRTEISRRMQKFLDRQGHPIENHQTDKTTIPPYRMDYKQEKESDSAPVNEYLTTHGCFEQIFPFNAATSAAAGGSSNNPPGQAALSEQVKLFISEVKQRARAREKRFAKEKLEKK